MGKYYLKCVVCGSKIRVSKKLVEWLREHRGNLGLIIEAYPRCKGMRGFEEDTEVLRFTIEKDSTTVKEAFEQLQE